MKSCDQLQTPTPQWHLAFLITKNHALMDWHMLKYSTSRTMSINHITPKHDTSLSRTQIGTPNKCWHECYWTSYPHCVHRKMHWHCHWEGHHYSCTHRLPCRIYRQAHPCNAQTQHNYQGVSRHRRTGEVIRTQFRGLDRCKPQWQRTRTWTWRHRQSRFRWPQEGG